jgi:hypothetical protein
MTYRLRSQGSASGATAAEMFETAQWAHASEAVILTFIAGLMLWRHPRADVSPAMRLAGAGGLMLSGLATLLIAGYMSQRGAHWVGTPSDAAGLPLVGWSTVGGDLRAPHFLATHAAQTVPLFALA